MQKVLFDTVNNKEVVDITGAQDTEALKTQFGLDASTQMVMVDTDAGMASEVVSGTLQVFDADARSATAATAAEVTRQAAEDTTKTNLGLDQAGYDALIASMK